MATNDSEASLISSATAGQIKLPKMDFNSIREGALGREERAEVIRQFMGAVNSKQQLITALDELKNMDVVQTILDVFIDDGLISTSQGTLFTVNYKEEEDQDEDPEFSSIEGDEKEKQTQLEEEVNGEIKDFMNRVGLDAFLRSILEDILRQGEYPFRIIAEENKGILELKDDLNFGDVLTLYEGNEVSGYLERRGRKVVERDTDEVGHFAIFPMKIRVSVVDWREGRKKQLPVHYRLGRSLIYPAISKLRRLQILEMGSVAESLRKVLMPSIVSIGVPANTEPGEAAAIVGRYERMLQPPMKSPEQVVTVPFGDIFEMVGRVKVIPNFSDGKGKVDPVNLDQGEGSAIDERENRLRIAVAMAIGMPAYHLSLIPGQTPEDKVHTLKLYARYSRKLISIQESLAAGVKDLIHRHLSLKGIKVTKDLIKVNFKALVNMDLLDSVEYAVASVQTLRDLHTALQEIGTSDVVNLKVNSKVFKGIASRFLSVLGEQDLLVESDGIPINPLPPGGEEGGMGPVGDQGPGGLPLAPAIIAPDQADSSPEEPPIEPEIGEPPI